MWRPRLSLRVFLLIFTAVAVFFGVSQIHRRSILQMVKDFKAEGATVEVKDEWIDLLWMRRPTKASFRLNETQLTTLVQRLEASGISEVDYVIDAPSFSSELHFSTNALDGERTKWKAISKPAKTASPNK